MLGSNDAEFSAKWDEVGTLFQAAVRAATDALNEAPLKEVYTFLVGIYANQNPLVLAQIVGAAIMREALEQFVKEQGDVSGDQ